MADEAEIQESLEQRLQNHAKAFESLMALTPAREYYGSQIEDGLDPSEQWSRKKQTKEQKRAAKKAKLDPANQKSALDVMKERERKRKRELGMEDEAGEADAEAKAGEVEESSAKRQKVEHDDEAKRQAKVEKRKEKRAAKKEKIERKKAKADAKRAMKQAEAVEELEAEAKQDVPADDEEDDGGEQPDVSGRDMDLQLDAFESPEPQTRAGGEVESDRDNAEASSAPTSPAVDSPAFDFEAAQSTTSSSSSIIPPSVPEHAEEAAPPKAAPSMPIIDTTLASANARLPGRRSDPPSGISSPKIQLPNIDQAELQERLRLRIEELRARRKADGPDGRPAKSRQELLEQRRKKEEQRKAAKKEQRRQAKEDEQRKREDQLRGSGSPLSVDMFSPRPQQPAPETNFSFSRLAFDDGTAADASLTTLTDPRRKKGPQDPRTALEAAQKKQARIAGLDADKRADIGEKDMWLHAKQRAHGERVRDDTSLLKKALKRKEKAKGKSAEQWQERQEAVVKGKEMKQKKREGNLARRREEKGGKGKGTGAKKGGKPGGAGNKKGKGRPGFEGRLKA
ncbi:hypothetical protein LTR53_005312 [Teratosphaeriaceae sp. CCFEE 6253]|nr:hypothetical protein LTR53_005312 [Teratosphaeriaceae sp. CCFEE 6253]